MNCQVSEEATVPRLKTDVERGGGEKYVTYGCQAWRTLRQADNATFRSDPVNHGLPESMPDGMVLAQTTSLERFWLSHLFFKHQKFKFQGQNTREISWSRGMSIGFQASGNLARSCKFVTNSDKSCNRPVFCLATYTELSDFKGVLYRWNK